MPFAQETFQSLMNHIFKPYLRIFVVVFFNDILAYSKDRTAQKKHLLTVFSILVENKPHINSAKCHMGKERLEYLGHWISAQGMAADDTRSRLLWHATSKAFQFPGSSSILYCRFVRGFATIAWPLTQLLKNNAFK